MINRTIDRSGARRLGAVLGFLCMSVCAAASADGCGALKTLATYTRDESVAYQDEKDPALFHVYEATQPDTSKSRADAPYVYKELDVRYTGSSRFATTQLKAIPDTAVTDQFSSLEDRSIAIVDAIDKGKKIYSLFANVKIDQRVSVDATIERNPEQYGEVISHLMVHCKGQTFTQDFENGWIRIVSPVTGVKGDKRIAVVVDYCGNGGCTSEIDILAAQ